MTVTEAGLCTWNQVTNDQFDWTLTHGTTGTVNTGPSTDHTTGNGEWSFFFSTVKFCP